MVFLYTIKKFLFVSGTCTISLCLNQMATRHLSIPWRQKSESPHSLNPDMMVYLHTYFCFLIVLPFPPMMESMLQVFELVRRYHVHRESITHLWETKPCPSLLLSSLEHAVGTSVCDMEEGKGFSEVSRASCEIPQLELFFDGTRVQWWDPGRPSLFISDLTAALPSFNYYCWSKLTITKTAASLLTGLL